jgi:hypothetical protein
MKMSIRVVVLAAVAALGALALAAPAMAVYTKPTLRITYTGTTTNIVATADVNEDSTARSAIYVAAGTALTTNQAAGTVIGTAKAQVSALALGGALLPLEGNIVVAAPGAVAPATQAQCTQGQAPITTWVLVLQAAGQTINLPAFLLPTAGTETALGPAKLVFCLPPPDVPQAQGGATFGAKFLQADLKVNGVFSAVDAGAWIAIWTPYFPLNGQPNAPATVASPAAIAPGQVTLAVAKSGRTRVRLTATLTQGGQPTAGTVQIFAGAKRTALKRVKILKAGANGRATFTYAGKGIFFRVRGSAAARSAPPLCAALGALPAPCVNPTVTGFSEQSAISRRPA